MSRTFLAKITFGILLLTTASSFGQAATGKSKSKAKAKTKVAGRVDRPVGEGDEPPPCVHESSAKATRRQSPRSMPEMFDRMSETMARNPAGGFGEVLRDQEASALREVSLSVAEEKRIGIRARDAWLRKAAASGHPELNDPARLAYLKKLVENFHRRMKHKDRYPEVEIRIIEGPVSDGQSFPGGFLVFTSALLREPDEASVAAVVAHELAHLDRGHLNEYARREKLTETAFRPEGNAMADPSRFMTQGMALGSLMMDPFRPEHEHEADCTSTTWLYQEGYNPHALADFFDRLHRRNQDEPDQAFFRISRSHPYSLDRRNAVLARLTQLQRWKPREDLGLYADNLRRLTPKPPSP